MEDILKTISESKNRLDALKKLKWDNNTYGYRKLNKFIKSNNIDVSHFETKQDVYYRVIENNKLRKLPLEVIMVVNSTYSNGTSLKKRLYDEGLRKRKCEICEQGEIWNGVHMSLILDHINGIHDDNRNENIRIVCPNCNATLSTHCGKNKKRTNKVIRTSEDKSKTKKNVSVIKRLNKRPPCDELNSSIVDVGYSATGRKYGVSDNAIRKWIKFYMKYGA
jgi:hypothetical protein